jgi:hypothetical protein
MHWQKAAAWQSILHSSHSVIERDSRTACNLWAREGFTS